MPQTQKPIMTRAQKLKWYAGDLMAEADTEVKAGNPEGAVSHYLQAAEIFLLLAKMEQNYTAWRYYTDSATRCQQNTKKLIAMSPKEGRLAEQRTPSNSAAPS